MRGHGGKARASILSLMWKTFLYPPPPFPFYYPTASTRTFNMSHISTCVCVGGRRSVHVHMQMCARDTHPSITSLESFRSRCAPIHTHSHCFDFSKYKDVNHLPPLRQSRGIHTHWDTRTARPAVHTHLRAHAIHQRPPPTSLHLSPALSRHSPSAIPLFESNFMCQRGA